MIYNPIVSCCRLGLVLLMGDSNSRTCNLYCRITSLPLFQKSTKQPTVLNNQRMLLGLKSWKIFYDGQDIESVTRSSLAFR